jgi:hypothetical protein
MIIEVKRKHIKEGLRDEPCDCPIALAMKDAGFELPMGAGVDNEHIDVADRSFKTTRSARRFMAKFDKTGKGKPFRFRLIEAK